MSRDINPFGLRMPPSLREKLERSARADGRSLNAEIVHRLEESFPLIEGELLKRRLEETRRLLEAASDEHEECTLLENQLRALAGDLKIENAAEDPRTRDLYARMRQSLDRVNLLDELHQRCDAELQFLLARVKA